ncbi:hypothetical protein ACIQUF_24890 [Pseudomonas sp. NPDC090233]|uniref:hypothetical protein n=1 Tax=Pseudomonas sp. NPDC090233 TaxID=3364479 RepID=UPI00383B027F
MFSDYLVSYDAYIELENHFESSLRDFCKSNHLDVKEFVMPYYNNTCVDGTRLMDANPIFSTRHQQTGNILRVVICDEVRGYSSVHKDVDGFDELCLFIKLKSLSRALKDINSWAKAQASVSKRK